MPLNLLEVPLAGVVIDVVSGTLGMMLLVTGAVAGMLRAGAVLAASEPERVEWLTAAGFAGGVAIALLVLALDTVLG